MTDGDGTEAEGRRIRTGRQGAYLQNDADNIKRTAKLIVRQQHQQQQQLTEVLSSVRWQIPCRHLTADSSFHQNACNRLYVPRREISGKGNRLDAGN